MVGDNAIQPITGNHEKENKQRFLLDSKQLYD